MTNLQKTEHTWSNVDTTVCCNEWWSKTYLYEYCDDHGWDYSRCAFRLLQVNESVILQIKLVPPERQAARAKTLWLTLRGLLLRESPRRSKEQIGAESNLTNLSALLVTKRDFRTGMAKSSMEKLVSFSTSYGTSYKCYIIVPTFAYIKIIKASRYEQTGTILAQTSGSWQFSPSRRWRTNFVIYPPETDRRLCQETPWMYTLEEKTRFIVLQALNERTHTSSFEPA